jgi:hypothetical protein
MISIARSLVIMVIVLCVTQAVVARTHHSAPNRAVSIATAPSSNIPEQARDPADVALDRKIKGICRGC